MSLIYSHLHENYGDDQVSNSVEAASLMALMDPELVSPSTSYYQVFDSEPSIKIPDFQHNYMIGGEISQATSAYHHEPLELLDLIDQDLLLEDITKLLDESEQFESNNNSDLMEQQQYGVANDLAVMAMELPDSPPLDSSPMSCYAVSSPSMDSYNEDSLNELITDPRRRSSGRGVTSGRICKRESNREAANRYRVKKQKERDSLFAECAKYDEINNELRKKIDETQAEISIIKNLLLEALATK